jgi:inorganic phosphate transporter, PiT family
MGWLLRFLPLAGGGYLGWTLGANDASNVFGTAVATRIIRLRTALILCSIMVVIGAALQGTEGIETLSGITHQTVRTAVVASVAAAITGTVMTILSLPISTSQAVVGAILGIALATGNAEYGGLIKVVLCWIGTPVGSMLIAMIAYKVMAFIFRHVPIGILTRDKILWTGLIVVGSYGSYALGANNVANTTGMFSGLIEGVSDRTLALVGGLSMAIGVLSYSKRVMFKVGSGIMLLDGFTAFVAVLSMSVTVHIFAMVGAPVSTSQGIVGAIMGIGVLRGTHVIKFQALRSIAFGWLVTPLVSLILAAAGFAIFC